MGQLNWNFHKAVNCINQGGVLAYPTEGVWGLGCDPHNDEAVQKILAMKQRPWQKGLILIADTADYFEPLLAGLQPSVRTTILNTWPGPVTWVVPVEGVYTKWVRGIYSSVAIRVTNHPLVSKLINLLGFPVVSTSANPGGCLPAQSLLRARCYFGNKVDYYLPGPLGGLNQSSQIRDALTGNILRS